MTVPSRTPGSAVVDGVNVDAVAAAARGCAGVAALDGGQYGQTVSYLPGRIVAGVRVSGERVRVQVRSRWGIPVPDVAAAIVRAVAPLAGHRPVDVTVADIDDPPGA
jgi:hypothetical protein